jgi:hypothetical protein
MLDFGLGLRPNASGGSLTLNQTRWCLAQKLRVNLLGVFYQIPLSESLANANKQYGMYCSPLEASPETLSVAKAENLKYVAVIMRSVIDDMKMFIRPDTQVFFSAPSDSRIIRETDAGFRNCVKWTQEMLSIYGYFSGKADGVYEARTKSAILRFQLALGIYPDGTLTKDLLSLLTVPINAIRDFSAR